jgi:hypothetical protein
MEEEDDEMAAVADPGNRDPHFKLGDENDEYDLQNSNKSEGEEKEIEDASNNSEELIVSQIGNATPTYH